MWFSNHYKNDYYSIPLQGFKKIDFFYLETIYNLYI